MHQSREIWVLPEIEGKAEEISKLSGGLLSEAAYIAGKVSGQVTAVVLGENGESYAETLGKYRVSRACVFKHPLLKYFSAETSAPILAERIQAEKPWLFLMGNTTAGRELAPRLAALLRTGVATGCVKMDLSDLEKPVFYRPTYGEQAYQEIVFSSPGVRLVTMDPAVFNIIPAIQPAQVKVDLIEPKLAVKETGVKHLAFLPADFKTMDVADAAVIVSAGMGAIDPEIWPLIRELADLLEGSIGTTRPVVDEGQIGRERMIGQTGKVVSPELYLALGISGATHHLGGIQESGTIVAVNRDPRAPIFQNADAGVIADLKAVLPGLIEKIKKNKITVIEK